jgi:hypothetical protein
LRPHTDSKLTLREYARETLRTRLGRVAFEFRHARHSLNEERIHDMRVAIRRLTAAMRIFADAVPKAEAKRVRRDLKEIMEPAGVVRELDVARELLADHGAHDLPVVLDHAGPLQRVARQLGQIVPVRFRRPHCLDRQGKHQLDRDPGRRIPALAELPLRPARRLLDQCRPRDRVSIMTPADRVAAANLTRPTPDEPRTRQGPRDPLDQQEQPPGLQCHHAIDHSTPITHQLRSTASVGWCRLREQERVTRVVTGYRPYPS